LQQLSNEWIALIVFQWFEEKIQNIEALENQLRKVHNSVELLVAHRKDLAHSTGIFAKSAAILSNSEEHTGLARALAQLADVEDKVRSRLFTVQLIIDEPISISHWCYCVSSRLSKCILIRQTLTSFYSLSF